MEPKRSKGNIHAALLCYAPTLALTPTLKLGLGYPKTSQNPYRKRLQKNSCLKVLSGESSGERAFVTNACSPGGSARNSKWNRSQTYTPHSFYPSSLRLAKDSCCSLSLPCSPCCPFHRYTPLPQMPRKLAAASQDP